ncbi:MAG: hypothetical protein H0X30_12640 [Anaerolineae bacterium]|nr:hypothetical protein [Anaerolineae bacterium]
MKYTRKLSYMIVFVLLFAVGLFTVGAQDNAPQVQLNPDKTQAAAGDSVIVTVNVTGAVGVYGGSFKLSYDPQAFEVVQTDNKPVTPGAFLANEPGFALRNAVDATAGTIEYAITLMQPAKPVDGDGILGTFTLHALKDSPVAITAMSASFVVPEFKEIDGHLVAQKVNQVTAQVQGSAAAPSQPVAPAPAVVNTVPVVAPTVEVANVAAPVQPVLLDNAAVTMFSNPQLNAVTGSDAANAGVMSTSTVNRTDNAVSIAAIAFLVVGVVLLTLSVGMYSRMRVRYTTLAGNK